MYTGSLLYIPTGKKGQKRIQYNIWGFTTISWKVFNYYKMSVKTFDELLNTVKSDLEKEQNIKGDTIPAVERLSITLK